MSLPARQLKTGAPATIGTANTKGSADDVALSDHVHAHGAQTDGGLHALASGTGHGFFSSSDFTKLAAISPGATNTPFASAAPAALGTAAVGTTASGAARGDHVHSHGVQSDPEAHALATASSHGFLSSSDFTKLAALTGTSFSGSTPSPLGTAATGSETAASRGDHVHAHGSLTDPTNHALANGSNAGFLSTSDFTKLAGLAVGATNTPLSSSTPFAVGTGSAGTGSAAARADHVHAHGVQTDPLFHALASGSTHGFLSSSDFTKLAALEAGATNTPYSSTTPSAVGTASVGTTATGAARGDHTHAHGVQSDPAAHALATGSNHGFLSSSDYTKLAGLTNTSYSNTTPSALGAAAVGTTATGAARGDHVHPHGSQIGGTTHSLADASDSGFLAASDFSKLASVSAGADNTLAALAAVTSTVTINNQRLAGILDPLNPQDAASKAYVDAIVQGLDVKNSCRMATTGPVTLAGGAPNTLDGVGLLLNDRVLVKDQTNAAQNGIYTVTTLGSGTNGTWARAIDADTSFKVTSSLFTFVSQGTLNADSGWTLVTDGFISLGTTALTFTQFSGAGQINAGTGLVKSGNLINVVANSDGSIIANADDIQVGILATDAQHGARGGSNLHALATGSANGFLSSSDFTKLAGVEAGAQVTTFTRVQTALSGASSPVAFNSQKLTGLLDPTAAQDAATKNYVDTNGATAIVGGTGLTKTGNTLNVIANADGSIVANADDIQVGVLATDAQHGTRGGGTTHALATGSTNGFLSSSDFTKLAGLAIGSTNTPFSSTTPSPVGTAAIGTTATGAARGDHVHAHGTQLGGTLHSLADGTNAGFLSSSDFTKLAGLASGSTNTPYSSTTPSALGAAAIGTTATGAARGDHVHAHGFLVGGTLHALADGTNPGFLASSDFTKLAGVETGAQVTSFARVQTALAAATSAVAFNAQRLTGVGDPTGDQDVTTKAYVLAQNQLFSTTYPTAGTGLTRTTGTINVVANADGSIVSNADDIQVGILATDAQHGSRGGAALHALATGSANGFLSSSDFTKLVGIESGAQVTTFTRVQTALAAATNDVAFNSHKLTGLLDPTAAQDAATKNYFDTYPAFGWLRSAKAIGSGATFDPTSTAPSTFAGISVTVGDRYVLFANSPFSTNGIWEVLTVGSGSNGVWRKALDCDGPGVNKCEIGSCIRLSGGTQIGQILVCQTASYGGGGWGTQFQYPEIVDLNHGSRSGGTLHALATGSANGFLSSSDFTKLAGVEAGAQAVSFARVQTALAAATSALTFNSQKLSSVLDPTAAQDVVTKTYAESNFFAVSAGWLRPARIFSNAFGGDPTTSAPNILDGQTLVVGDRIINQGLQPYLAIYEVVTVGTGSNGVWKRAADCDALANNKCSVGSQIRVLSGTYANVVWLCSSIFLSGSAQYQFAAFWDLHDTNHGTRSGGTLHALATGSANGFLSSSDFTKLAGIEAGAQAVSFARVQAALDGATSPVSFSLQRLIGVGDPTGLQHAATKNYVDSNLGLRELIAGKYLRNVELAVSGTAVGALASTTYWVFLGVTAYAMNATALRWVQTVAAVGTNAGCQCGFATTPLAPNGSVQTFTVAAVATIPQATLTQANTIVRTQALAYSIPAGTPLYIFYRNNTGFTTQPSFIGLFNDQGLGQLCVSTTQTTAYTAGTTVSANTTIATFNATTAACPDIWAMF